MFKLKLPRYFFQLIVAVAVLLPVGSAVAVIKPRLGETALMDTYHRNLSRLGTNSYGIPLVVESFEQDDRVQVDVYGIFDYSYSSVVNALKVPANWCDIVSLHPNIKACTYKQLPGAWLLSFYPGGKVYQSPDDSSQVVYRYTTVVQQQNYLDILLNADSGPYGTRDHRMRFEALPIDGTKTFVHVSYAYSDSVALRLATKVYFATLGRSKVGFTVVGTNRSGKPDYIRGPRGALERSAVRYFLAIQSFMHTLRYPEASRFNMRISEWHDLTTVYRKQLFDLDKNDYINFKTAEHKNQVVLQRRIGSGSR